jgi:anti-anti-sigma factor
MAIEISERRRGDVTILEVRGRVVFADGASELRSRVNDLVDEARLNFLLDLRAVSYIDSFGVGVIASKYASVRRKGGDLKLLCLSPRCQKVLGTAGLLNIFETFQAEDEALRSFGRARE